MWLAAGYLAITTYFVVRTLYIGPLGNQSLIDTVWQFVSGSLEPRLAR